MDFAWLLPYTGGIHKVENMCIKYLSRRRDHRQWLGMAESLIALSYLRFRPGAKLKVSGLTISNDHSHQLHFRDWLIDLQSVKRSIVGGSSLDLLNFKTPVYYSYQLLQQLPAEERQILLQLASESVAFLIEDTYAYDLSAQDCLKAIQLVLNKLNDTQTPKIPNAELAEFLCIKEEYNEHPLTVENLRVWTENLPLLREICHQLKQAHERYLHGGAYEENLTHVREAVKRIRGQMRLYLENLEHV